MILDQSRMAATGKSRHVRESKNNDDSPSSIDSNHFKLDNPSDTMKLSDATKAACLRQLAKAKLRSLSTKSMEATEEAFEDIKLSGHSGAIKEDKNSKKDGNGPTQQFAKSFVVSYKDNDSRNQRRGDRDNERRSVGMQRSQSTNSQLVKIAKNNKEDKPSGSSNSNRRSTRVHRTVLLAREKAANKKRGILPRSQSLSMLLAHDKISNSADRKPSRGLRRNRTQEDVNQSTFFTTTTKCSPTTARRRRVSGSTLLMTLPTSSERNEAEMANHEVAEMANTCTPPIEDAYSRRAARRRASASSVVMELPPNQNIPSVQDCPFPHLPASKTRDPIKGAASRRRASVSMIDTISNTPSPTSQAARRKSRRRPSGSTGTQNINFNGANSSTVFSRQMKRRSSKSGGGNHEMRLALGYTEDSTPKLDVDVDDDIYYSCRGKESATTHEMEENKLEKGQGATGVKEMPSPPTKASMPPSDAKGILNLATLEALQKRSLHQAACSSLRLGRQNSFSNLKGSVSTAVDKSQGFVLPMVENQKSKSRSNLQSLQLGRKGSCPDFKLY